LAEYDDVDGTLLEKLFDRHGALLGICDHKVVFPTQRIPGR